MATLPTGETTDSQYAGLTGYGSAYQDAFQKAQSLHSDSAWERQQIASTLDQTGNQFSNLFQNFVGRAPTQDELNKFFQDNQISVGGGTSGINPNLDAETARNKITQYVSDNFQQAARDVASQNLQNQVGQAQTLAGQFRAQGQQAISGTEGMLQDYAKRLFTNLQPQLLTSLQAMGKLDSGALNEAEAGAQKDLAAQSQGFLANANLNLENQANQIAFGGASAPYYYQQGQYLNQVPYLQQQGQNALNYGNQYAMQNLGFQQQMALLNQQQQGQFNMAHPGFGTNFSNSFGQGLGMGLGGNLTSNLNGPAWNKGGGGGSGLPTFG